MPTGGERLGQRLQHLSIILRKFDSRKWCLQAERLQGQTCDTRLYSTTQEPCGEGAISWDEAGDELVLMLAKEGYLNQSIEATSGGLLRKYCQAEGKGTFKR